MNELVQLVAVMIVVGLASGVLSGLFGIGGGAVLVPLLIEVFAVVDVDGEVATHLAIGTSLAIIVPTAVRSYRAHQQRGAPDDSLLRSWVVLVPAGVLAASLVVSQVSGATLRVVFAVVAILISAKMLLGRDGWRLADDLPGQPWRSGAGFGIGFVSTFMGIGGGNLNNAFMTAYGRPIHQAVATSSGLGVLIAVPGVLVYSVIGWGHEQLPVASVGYVNLAALVIIMPLTALAAPMGASLAHRMSARRMEIAFGLFLLVVAVRFIASAF